MTKRSESDSKRITIHSKYDSMEYNLTFQSSSAEQGEVSDLSFSPLVPKPEVDSKVLFFDELKALLGDGSSDEEEDTNELKSVRISKKSPLPFLPFSFPSHDSPSHSPSKVMSNHKRIQVNPAEKLPTIHRTTSDPIKNTRIIAETPTAALPRTTSLLRHDISADATPNTSFNIESLLPEPTPSGNPRLERTVSTPTFGSVIMTHSMGIMNMLNNNSKKRKDVNKADSRSGSKKDMKRRKTASLSKIPEAEQYLKGVTFCYIPADDKYPSRKCRIKRVQDYGGIWAKAWDSSVSFVVVDDLDKTFDQALSDLKDTCPGVEIPLSVIFVNSNYPLECITHKKMLSHDQLKYKVKGFERESTQDSPQGLSDHSAEPAPKRLRSRQSTPPAQPAKSEVVHQYSPAFRFPESQVHIGENPYLVESPREASPEDVQYKSFGGELDELIRESKSTAHLPLDSDDDDNEEERPSFSEGIGEYDSDDYGSEGEKEHKAAAARKLLTKKKRQQQKDQKANPKPAGSFKFDQSTFSCMTGGSGDNIEGNPNRKTIEILLEMAAVYTRLKFLGDNWREMAYKRAAGVLKKQDKKICTFEEAFALPFIGERLAAKIEEIARTNRLRRLEYTLGEPDDYLLQLFSGVYNVGSSRAHEWVNAGYKTLEEVAQKVKLTKCQEIGIAHYVDFKTRIPREEVTALGKIVTDAAAEIDDSIEIIISGSYRRGVVSSGDIDCMITRTGTTSTSQLKRFLHKLVRKLTDDEFLVAALAVPSNETDDGSKWHGACVLPSSEKKIWRRIDFLLVPETEFGAALIYFTGDDIFNRSLRLLASKKGMRLNQRGLYKNFMRGKNRVKLTEGSLMEGADEKRIFEILGVPWREPHDRICQ